MIELMPRLKSVVVLGLFEQGFQPLRRSLFILVLGTPVACGRRKARGGVDRPDRRFGLVRALPIPAAALKSLEYHAGSSRFVFAVLRFGQQLYPYEPILSFAFRSERTFSDPFYCTAQGIVKRIRPDNNGFITAAITPLFLGEYLVPAEFLF